MQIPYEAKNWTTISNINNYSTQSKTPILKKDNHRAEIIDITDGLVVDDNPIYFHDLEYSDYESIDNSDVGSAFSKVDWSRN